MQQLLSTFARIIQEDRALEGTVFKRPFGSAPKVSPKEQRSSIIYLYNNPVEKRLCTRAADDRWTFLRYAKETFPFSSKLVKRNVRFQPLTREEQEQLTDYIIQRYQFIHHDEAIGRFDDYEAMLAACDASSGKEFDVGEVFDSYSDTPYRDMAHMAAKAGLFEDWKLFHLDPGYTTARARQQRTQQVQSSSKRTHKESMLAPHTQHSGESVMGAHHAFRCEGEVRCGEREEPLKIFCKFLVLCDTRYYKFYISLQYQSSLRNEKSTEHQPR